MVDKSLALRKELLRKNFLAGNRESKTDEAVLTLLLSCALPNKDVKPIVDKLLEKYIDLPSILSLDYLTLCKISGIKENTATLIKLTDWTRKNYPVKEPMYRGETQQQRLTGLEPVQTENNEKSLIKAKMTVKIESKEDKPVKKPVTGLFSNALMKETIEILPKLPETNDIEDLKSYLRNNLHFNSLETRQRYTTYITKRIFPDNKPDTVLIEFARKFQGRQDFKDICFYRFCKSEPLMYEVIQKLLLPAIDCGQVNRTVIREFVMERTNSPVSIRNSSKAIIDAISGAGIARTDSKKISFGYREIPLSALAFVIYSEFPEPGMYHISKLEQNMAIQSLLWNPDKLLPSLYELRNRGLISKISEIDNYRQFTTSCDLHGVVNKLTGA